MSALSPSSSPRLPSPPPMAEDQLGPLSPSAGISEEQGKAVPVGSVDHGASRRIRPGTKSTDMAEGPPLMELKDIDSAFQLTEHLKALHNSLTHPEGKDHSVPVDKTMAKRLALPPEGVDRSIWLYELCRFLSQKANSIIIALFADNPPCSSQTCPEMRASEWQYLCAVHDPPKSCCAIDYCCHTLDWAANTLTSPKSFPSRLALGTEMNNQHTQVRQLTNIFRRVYRIFAHAWFQHRDVFWKVEARTGLYLFFKTVCDVYNLIDKDNYTIPQEAEGLEEGSDSRSQPSGKTDSDRHEEAADPPRVIATPAGNTTTITGNTTKRHRQTPSMSQAPVTTVVEELEEEEEGGGKVHADPADASSAAGKEIPQTATKETSDESQVKESESDDTIAAIDSSADESVASEKEAKPSGESSKPDASVEAEETGEDEAEEENPSKDTDTQKEQDKDSGNSEQTPTSKANDADADAAEGAAKDGEDAPKSGAD